MASRRKCPRCGISRPLSEFAGDKSKASGHKSLCKSCDRARYRRYYSNNRVKKAAYYRARKARKEQ